MTIPAEFDQPMAPDGMTPLEKEIGAERPSTHTYSPRIKFTKVIEGLDPQKASDELILKALEMMYHGDNQEGHEYREFALEDYSVGLGGEGDKNIKLSTEYVRKKPGERARSRDFDTLGDFALIMGELMGHVDSRRADSPMGDNYVLFADRKDLVGAINEVARARHSPWMLNELTKMQTQELCYGRPRY